jgi:hypothetical protein
MEWEAILSIFSSDGMPRPIKVLIRYMISQGYNQIFLPGSSLFTLLVSVPVDNKVNYSYTLRVEYDERVQIIKFKFLERVSDLKQGHSVGARLIRWEETCQASVGAIILEEFLNSSDIFREAIAQYRLRHNHKTPKS